MSKKEHDWKTPVINMLLLMMTTGTVTDEEDEAVARTILLIRSSMGFNYHMEHSSLDVKFEPGKYPLCVVERLEEKLKKGAEMKSEKV